MNQATVITNGVPAPVLSIQIRSFLVAFPYGKAQCLTEIASLNVRRVR